MVHLLWNDVDEARRLLKQGRRAAVKDRASRYALRLAEVRLDASLGGAEEARESLAELTGEFEPSASPGLPRAMAGGHRGGGTPCVGRP